VTISKAAILGIALGALVILLMILVAVCRPHNPPVFKDVSISKPGKFISWVLLLELISYQCWSCSVQTKGAIKEKSCIFFYC
jgi:hypothetical protein